MPKQVGQASIVLAKAVNVWQSFGRLFVYPFSLFVHLPIFTSGPVAAKEDGFQLVLLPHRTQEADASFLFRDAVTVPPCAKESPAQLAFIIGRTPAGIAQTLGVVFLYVFHCSL